MNKALKVIIFVFAVLLVFIMGAFFAWTSDTQDYYCTVEIIEKLCSKYSFHAIIEATLGIIGATIGWFVAR